MKNQTLTNRISDFKIASELQEKGLYPYFREIISEQDTTVFLKSNPSKPILMLGSNSYLGLTNHPRVKEASINAIRKYGTGCGGSRFLNGTLDIHVELEEALADFTQKEAALLYSTGFMVNQGVISTLVKKNDYVISDKLNHASIIDGCFLSHGKILRYNHNDISDLEKKLIFASNENCNILVVTDGVFSMEGDIANLPDIVRLCQNYNAVLMVDDAHSLGVLGPNGDGTSAHFNLTNKVDLIMGTFSKSLASVGGFVAADREIINYLKHNSRAHIFSASMPPASAAAALEALKIIKDEPERIQKLWANTARMKDGLKTLRFSIGSTESPIIPVTIGDIEKTFLISKLLEEAGVFVNPVAAPAVPPNRALIRLSIMATHSFEQIDHALTIFEKLGKKFGII